MRPSLGRASLFVLSLGLLAGVAGFACANSEDAGPAPQSQSDEGGAGTVLDGGATDGASPTDDAEPAVRDASNDSGPKKCSDHGFCPTPVAANQTFESLWGDGSGVVWAATTEGDLLRWDGSAWNVHASGLGALHAVWGSSATDVWVGGEKGILHGTGTSAAALTFAQDALPGGPVAINAIWGSAANEVWAVGVTNDPDTWESFGRVFHFQGKPADPNDPGASDWTLEPISSNGVLYSQVWGNDAGAVWVGGTRPMVDATWFKELVVVGKNGGGDFVETALPIDPDPATHLNAKGMRLLGSVFTSKTTMTVYGQAVTDSTRASSWHGTSADGGKTFSFTWAADHRASSPPLNALAGTGANDIWAAGEYGRLIHWNGSAWSTTAISVTGLPVTDPFTSIWAHGTSDIWIGGKGMALRFDPTQVKAGGAK